MANSPTRFHSSFINSLPFGTSWLSICHNLSSSTLWKSISQTVFWWFVAQVTEVKGVDHAWNRKKSMYIEKRLQRRLMRFPSTWPTYLWLPTIMNHYNNEQNTALFFIQTGQGYSDSIRLSFLSVRISYILYYNYLAR